MTIGSVLTFCLLLWFGALAMLVASRLLDGTINCSGMLASKPSQHGVDPERVAAMGLVPAILAYYAIHALNTGAVPVGDRMSMPELPEALVSLLTGSNGLYLAGKLARRDDAKGKSA